LIEGVIIEDPQYFVHVSFAGERIERSEVEALDIWSFSKQCADQYLN
jgi:hypothetical protein